MSLYFQKKTTFPKAMLTAVIVSALSMPELASAQIPEAITPDTIITTPVTTTTRTGITATIPVITATAIGTTATPPVTTTTAPATTTTTAATTTTTPATTTTAATTTTTAATTTTTPATTTTAATTTTTPAATTSTPATTTTTPTTTTTTPTTTTTTLPSKTVSFLRLIATPAQGEAGKDVSFETQATFAPLENQLQTPPAQAPTGSVTISFQGKNCTASLSVAPGTPPEQRISSGTCVIQNVSAGENDATAAYAGDSNYGPGSATLRYIVAAANPPGMGQSPAAPPAPVITLTPDSDTGISSTDAKTQDDTPTLRVSLAGNSKNPYAANDVVTIFQTSLGVVTEVGSVTLTTEDITRGEATVTTTSLGADGNKSLTATVSRGMPRSAPSSPLLLLLDRTPPVLASASINGAIATLNYTETGSGIDASPPKLSLFALITEARTSNAPVRGTINKTNNTVRLEFTQPVAKQTPVRLNYTSDPEGVRDVAGNLAASVATLEVTNLTTDPEPSKPPTTPQPPAPPAQPITVNPPPNSEVIVTDIAPSQPAAIDSTAARFNSPAGIARDKLGNLYVTDQNNYTVRKIATNGAVTTIAGKVGESIQQDGPVGTSRFQSPGAITVDQAGNLYLIDNRNLRKIDVNGNVTTIVTTPAEPLLGGPNTFGLPAGLAVDTTGNVFVADYLVGAIWKVAPDGNVTRFVTIGQGIANLAGAGPSGIAIDAANNLYVSDLPYSLNAGGFSSIHKVTPTGTVTLLHGPTLGLVNARGTGIDDKDNLYVNQNLVIVRIAAAGGTVTAYQLPASAESGAVSAASIALNAESGAVYFTDSAKHTVSRLDPDGKITIIAGRTGEAGSVDVER